MIIKRCLARFDQKHVFSLFFVCSLSPGIFNYACPNFRTTCVMALMRTLHHEFELSMHPSIPSTSHIGGLCTFLFYYSSPKKNELKFSYNRMQVSIGRLRACVVKCQMNRGVNCNTNRNLCSRCVFMKIKENGWIWTFLSIISVN